MHADKQPQNLFFLPPRQCKNTRMIPSKTDFLLFLRARSRIVFTCPHFTPYVGLYVCPFVFSVRTAYTFTRYLCLFHFVTNSLYFKSNHWLCICLSVNSQSAFLSVIISLYCGCVRCLAFYCKQIVNHFINGREKKKKRKKKRTSLGEEFLCL